MSRRDNPAPLIAAGELIDAFRVVRRIGRGKMGEVYLARDTHLGRRVALKIIPLLRKGKGHAQADEEIQRFLFEARTTARFNHPNIVTVYSAGMHDELPYLALEYLDGESLRQRMRTSRLSVKETLRTVLPVAEALREAHRHRVVHGDLKPANVLIPGDGRPRVVDFGLARALCAVHLLEGMSLSRVRAQETPSPPGQPSARATQALQVALKPSGAGGSGLQGTPAYMAPEMWKGERPAEASDVWALGVILFELLAGRRPYRAASMVELGSLISGPEPAPPLDDQAAPAELVQLVHACMLKQSSRRPTAADVAGALQGMLQPSPARVAAVGSPFRGLQPFGEDHADFFFGREQELGVFVERLRQQPVLAVVGPSGAGKSSFVRAGVIPRLREQGSWTVIQIRPGRQPFAALGAAIGARMPGAAGERGVDSSNQGGANGGEVGRSAELARADAIREQIERSPRVLSVLLERLGAQRDSRVLLFVDQLEEIFNSLESEPRRERFVEAVCQAADDPLGSVRVVLAVREDFLGRLPGGAPTQAALSSVAVMRPPAAPQLAETLVKPLEAVGYRFEDEAIVEEMVAAAGEELAALPLLQFTAQALWEQRDRERRLLTRAAYEALGGVGGALATHADSVLAGLTPADEGLVRDILLRLVSSRGTRRLLPRSQLVGDLGERAGEVLDRLVEARLVAVRRGRDEQPGETELELAHESLAHSWGRLARWIERSREDLAFLHDVGQAAELWHKRGEHDDELWQGDALADALRTLRRCSAPVPERVARFVAAASSRERRRVRRRRTWWALAALVCVVGMLALAWQNRRTELQRRRARRNWAAAEREAAETALVRGALLEARARLRSSLEAQDSPLSRALWWRLHENPLLWSRDLGANVYAVAFSPDGTKVAAAIASRSISLFDARTAIASHLRAHGDQVLAVAFSPDGVLLAAGEQSGRVTLHDLRSGTARKLAGHTGAVRSLAFRPDGRRLASGGADKTVRIWELDGDGAPEVLRGHRAAIYAIAYSPDGRRLASGSTDRTIRIWIPGSSGGPRVIQGHDGAVGSVAYSPDGKEIASGGADRTVRIWDASSGAQRRLLRGHSGAVRAVAFSPDGERLASAGTGGAIRVWNPTSGRQLEILRGHAGTVMTLRFALDGKRLASGGSDHELRLWRVGSGQQPAALRGHAASVYGVDFAPDGERIASAGIDGTIRIWNAATGAQRRVLRGHGNRVTDVSWGPRGRFVVSGSADRTLRLWYLASGGESRVVGGHRSAVRAVSFSPDGRHAASCSNGKLVYLWDARRWKLEAALEGHQHLVQDVAFSPDGKLLASASKDGTIRLWDAATGAPRQVLGGHGALYGVAFGPQGQRIASAGADGSVRLWQLGSGAQQLLDKRAGRAYRVAFGPLGKRIAASRSDTTALLIAIETGTVSVLRGHRDEVNDVAFSGSGRLVATTSDDGTVRLWETASGRPAWFGTVMLSSPPRLLSHRGWQRLAGSGPAPPPEHRWRAAVEKDGRLASEAAGRTLCVATHSGRLQLWDIEADRRLLEQPAAQVAHLRAFPGGCIALVAGEARLYTQRGVRRLAASAGAVGYHESEVMVATGERVKRFDRSGAARGSPVRIAAGVTALGRSGRRLLLGFEDGSIELVTATAGGKKHSVTTFRQTPSSPVQTMVDGPRHTLIAGFAGGQLGIWQLENGKRIWYDRLHGPVIHMLLRGSRLYAATELGDYRVVDLRAFRASHCELLRELWKEIPVVWQDGTPRVRTPPRHHRCSSR